SVCVCFTLRSPLTSLGWGAFFRVTPVRPDRLTDCSSLSLTSPRQSTTNHADNSPSPAATTFQFHLQIPFLPSPYIPSPHRNCCHPSSSSSSRCCAGSQVPYPSIQFPFIPSSWNA
uniref:Uncharacterized protein n=1 Tax=Aegilops tauschii subsp. strangulata TaxID=200361 RepID=A0A453HSU0_AEGTS